jgi:hypothetical protein
MADREANVASPRSIGLASEPEVDYHREWSAYAFRHHLAMLLLYTWLPLCAVLFYLSRNYIHKPLTCLAVMGVWLVSALLAVWWAGEFRCPRCRRRYAALGHKSGNTNLTRGIFDKVCSNCKLTKFEIVR